MMNQKLLNKELFHAWKIQLDLSTSLILREVKQCDNERTKNDIVVNLYAGLRERRGFEAAHCRFSCALKSDIITHALVVVAATP
jgi:hypothetical protein